jgi:hypothetical protein
MVLQFYSDLFESQSFLLITIAKTLSHVRRLILSFQRQKLNLTFTH